MLGGEGCVVVAVGAEKIQYFPDLLSLVRLVSEWSGILDNSGAHVTASATHPLAGCTRHAHSALWGQGHSLWRHEGGLGSAAGGSHQVLVTLIEHGAIGGTAAASLLSSC